MCVEMGERLWIFQCDKSWRETYFFSFFDGVYTIFTLRHCISYAVFVRKKFDDVYVVELLLLCGKEECFLRRRERGERERERERE